RARDERKICAVGEGHAVEQEEAFLRARSGFFSGAHEAKNRGNEEIGLNIEKKCPNSKVGTGSISFLFVIPTCFRSGSSRRTLRKDAEQEHFGMTCKSVGRKPGKM